MNIKTILSVIIALLMISCSTKGQEKSVKAEENRMVKKELSNYSKAYFASGCFWCVEAIYESIEGVAEVISGYAGGTTLDPTYRTLASTDHAEVIEVYYDATKVDFKTLVDVFYGTQDPTTIGQHPDYGTQYRSIIFYGSQQEKEIAIAAKKAIMTYGSYEEKIVTEISPIGVFYRAEEYHQDYERLNPNQPYIRSVSIPRLNRFKKKFPNLLKEE